MIKGKKVAFRAVEEEDLELLLEWANDPVMSNLVVGWSFPLSMANQKEWFARSLKNPHTQRFIVESYEDGVIGLTGLWEIDWHNRHALTAVKLGAENIRGKGYGTDAILTLMSYAFFDVGLNRLWGAMLPYNIPSYKAYVERCGWRVEGILRQEIFRNGEFYDLIRVAVLKEDFVKHPRFSEYAPPTLLGKSEPQITIREEHRVRF
jgi:RimJ/RimL family protein N-acetyltransferase